MTFRDDHEAALARAEALEREVRRLRDENADLRTELEPLAREAERDKEREREQRAELERLAERAEREAKKPKRERKRRDPAKDAARKRLFALRNAFSGRLLNVAFVVGFLLAAVGSCLAGLWVLMQIGVLFPPLVIPFMAAGVVAFFGVWSIAVDAQVRRTRRWLAALPVSIDVDDYVDHMASDFSGTLVLELDIAGASGDEKLLVDAVRGGMPGAKAQWSEGTLVVTSPKLKTYYSGKGGGVSHNAKVHRWFRRFVKRVLRPIAERHRVALRIGKP